MVDPDVQHPLVWYIVLQAAEKFYAKFNRYPGVIDSTLGEDAKALEQEGTALVQELGLAEAFADMGMQFLLTEKNAPDYYKEL